MDPTKCWYDLLTAVSENDTDAIPSLAGGLRSWLNSDGFGPVGWDLDLVRGFIGFCLENWPPPPLG